MNDIDWLVFRDAPELPQEIFDLIYDYESWIHLGPHYTAIMIEREANIFFRHVSIHPFHYCSLLMWSSGIGYSCARFGEHGGNTFYCSRCGNGFQHVDPPLIPRRMFCPGCPDDTA